MAYSQKDKTKFRKSKKWLNFRKEMKEKQKVDYITGKKLSATMNLHHMDLNEENYEKLIKSHFICLNHTSHSVIHFFFGAGKVRKDWRKMIRQTIKILQIMEKINKASEN